MNRITLHELAEHCSEQNKRHKDNKNACLHCERLFHCSQYSRLMSKIEPRYWASGDRTLQEDILFSETDYYKPEKD